MSDTPPRIEQSPQPRTEQAGIHPEHMNYLYSRLSFTQQRIDRFGKPGAAVPLDNRLERAQADFARLQAAQEAALRGDVSGIAADLQRRHEEEARSLEQQRHYIEQHPMGTLAGDALYLKLKADILRGEKVLAKVGEDEEARAYIGEKIQQDKSTQATTERGKIMSQVAETHRELQRIQHLQHLLPQPGAKR